MMRFRTMEWEDIPFGLSLCRSAGWNQVARDWELFLALNKNGCRVCIDQESRITGTVTTLNYGDRFGWIGMLLVERSQQRKGIGQQLLKVAFEILRSLQTTKLDATPAGRNVYLKFGFVDEYPLTRLHAKVPLNTEWPPSTARPINADDMPRVTMLDEMVFGATRTLILEWMLAGAADLAFLVEENNELQGYCFGRRGFNFTHIGPVIARDAQAAENLMRAVLGNCKGESVILDVLHHTPAWQSWLSQAGFAVQRSFTRMYRGTNAWPGVPEQQFATLGPEFS